MFYTKLPIAEDAHINTVKSFCRRQNITPTSSKVETCLKCGVELPAYENGGLAGFVQTSAAKNIGMFI